MATLEEIVIQLTAETGQLRAEMAGAAKAVKTNTEQMEKAIEQFSKNGSKGTSFLQTSFATMAGFLGSQVVTGAFNMLVGLGKSLADALIEGGVEAEKEQASLNVLANSLAATGKYSEQAVKNLQNFAGEMEGLALVSQDVIQSNMQLLSSMTKLGEDGIKSATELAINFGAAYNKDLGAATDAIGKAINGNAAAFSKLGLNIELTGSKSENLKRIQEALAHTQGAAAAKAETYSGALFALKDGLGDTIGELSKTITQNRVVIAVMNELSKILASVKQYFAENADVIREKLGSAIVTIIDYLQGAVIGLKVFFQILNAGIQIALIPIRNLIDGFQLLKDAATLNLDGIKENVKDLANNYTTAFDAMANVGGDNAVFDTITDGLGRVGSAAKSALTEYGGAAAGINTNLQNTATIASDSTNKLTENQKALQDWAKDLAASYSDIANQTTLAKDVLKANLDMQLISQQDYFIQLQELTATQYADELAKLTDARTQELITEQQFADAKKALAAKQAAEVAKIEADRNKQKAADFKSTMDIIAAQANSSSKELAAIGKAAAIYNATIDGYAAIQKALSAAPPPFNFGLAAIVGAATAANVAKIAGVGLAGGIDSVPRSASGGNLGDNFPAVLKAGERVVPAETNQDLTQFLARQGNGANVNINVTIMPNTGMNNDQIENFIEQLNNFFASGGLKLIGAS